MDKKRRLLNALAPLEMPFEKKQDFVNLLTENTKDKENYVYYSGTHEDFQEYILLASVIKCKQSESMNFITSGWFRGVADDVEVISVGFDLSLKISSSFAGMSELITLEDFFAEVNTERWTQITEDEFYRDPDV